MMRFLLLFCVLIMFAPARAQRTVSGNVLVDSLALPGVNIRIEGTSRGTATDINGDYRLEVPDADSTVLIYSFVGYKTVRERIGNRTTININLQEDYRELETVVVTGYRSETRAEIIGSISSISSEDFEDIAINSPDQALQGLAAGVQVTQSSGTPGGGISVRIRGNTSISASNRPLFIVDGIPVQDGSLSLRSFGGQGDNALSTLNPNDIADLQVLKDASMKAIYGSRAANGVVLITTKRGTAGRTVVNFEVQRGLVDAVNKVELLNAQQLLDLQREAVRNAGEVPDAFGLIEGVTDAVDTDWLDEVLRTGLMQQYQLSMRGGSEQTRIYFSANYRDEEGVQLNNRFLRMSTAMNVDHKISTKISVGSNMTISKIRNDRVKGDNFLDGVYSGAIKSLPFYSPYDEQGELVGPGDGLYAGFPNFNPVGQAVLPRFETHTTKLLGGIFLDFQITADLHARSKVSVDYNNVIEDQFEPSTTAIGGFLPSVGGAGYGVYITGQYSTIVQNNTLDYLHSWQDHKVSGIVGTEVLYSKSRTGSVQGRLFPSDDFTYITSAGIVDAGSSFISENGLMSAFAEAKYNYNDKYLGGVTMRFDASSRFGEDRRIGYFPGLSAGYRITEEEFMQGVEFLDDLKLRASYGFTGNERIGNFNFLGTFASVTYNGLTGTGPASLGNPLLQWENTREINIGFDASLYEGRLQVTADVFSNLTGSLLLNRPLPLTTGFGSVTGNVGNLRNRGVELKVTTVNMDNGELTWRTDLNLSRVVNEVVALADTLPIFTGYTGQGVSSTSIVQVGQPLGAFWGLEFLGVDPATGDAIYADNNGDGRITEADATIIGSPQPDLFGGMMNTVTWKNFDLSMFFQFSLGNDILNFSNTSLLNTGQDIQTNQSIVALDRWQKPGDITYVPRYEWGNTFNNRHSSRFIEDGSYLRLKNLSLGYNIPRKYLDTYGLSSARVYFSGTNLLTFTNYSGGDPEVSTLDGSTTAQGIDFFTLPQVRTLMLGLKVQL